MNPRTLKGIWPIYAGFAALVLAMLWVGGLYLRNQQGPPVVAAEHTPVGTAGVSDVAYPGDSDATLHDLETMTGVNDPNQLIGRRVDFHAKVVDVNNYSTLWIGTGDRRVFVVLGRDNRNATQRDFGGPSPNNIKPVQAGQTARITGTIEDVPYAEARYGWGLRASEPYALSDLKVYIRADSVTPED